MKELNQQFTVVIRTTSECKIDSYEIGSEIDKFIRDKFGGQVFVKTIHFSKDKVRK